MVDTYAERSELGWTAQRLSETLKIQAEGAGFLAKSNLCSSEAELEGVNTGCKLAIMICKQIILSL